ncbi:oligosaccharide flippase family protein [Solitalea sp. MAHUQ-68]|uniref:Oligosaccharide flippase family protein n=1 Tax=Solitalea agri TaxID=2953739 RepID=A0A9X2F7F9_9SPHI|nr:oligosaccharide flippase family protein [Solitalea agri]MCO4293118.1 oligosaccharide flippase family protein [Solitalea agri]
MRILNSFLKSDLIKSGFVYIFSEAINKLVLFILLPILSVHLSPAEYGLLANFQVLILILTVLVGLNMTGIISVEFYRSAKEKLSNLINNILSILIISIGVFLLIVALLQSYLYSVTGIPSLLIYSVVIICGAQAIVQIRLEFWRLENKAVVYGVFYTTQSVIISLLTLYLVIWTDLGWQGGALAIAIGQVLFMIIALISLWRNGWINGKIEFQHTKSILSFGIPLIPHSLSFWMRNGLDRLLMTSFFDAKHTGLYSVGAQLAAPLQMVAFAMNKAYSPTLFKMLENKDEESKRKIVKMIWGVLGITLVLTIIIEFLLPIIVGWLLDARYRKSFDYFYWINISYFFSTVYFLIGNFIFYFKKTHLLTYVTFGTSLLHVLLTIIALKYIGPIGVAITTLFTSIIVATLTIYVVNSICKMPWFYFWRSSKIKKEEYCI